MGVGVSALRTALEEVTTHPPWILIVAGCSFGAAL